MWKGWLVMLHKLLQGEGDGAPAGGGGGLGAGGSVESLMPTFILDEMRNDLIEEEEDEEDDEGGEGYGSEDSGRVRGRAEAGTWADKLSTFEMLLLVAALDQTLLPSLTTMVLGTEMERLLPVIQRRSNIDVEGAARATNPFTPILFLSPSGGDDFAHHGGHVNAYREIVQFAKSRDIKVSESGGWARRDLRAGGDKNSPLAPFRRRGTLFLSLHPPPPFLTLLLCSRRCASWAGRGPRSSRTRSRPGDT
jgi:hypothetical protein